MNRLFFAFALLFGLLSCVVESVDVDNFPEERVNICDGRVSATDSDVWSCPISEALDCSNADDDVAVDDHCANDGCVRVREGC